MEKMEKMERMERMEKMDEIRRSEVERYELELERLVTYQESLQDVKQDILKGLV